MLKRSSLSLVAVVASFELLMAISAWSSTTKGLRSREGRAKARPFSCTEPLKDQIGLGACLGSGS